MKPIGSQGLKSKPRNKRTYIHLSVDPYLSSNVKENKNPQHALSMQQAASQM